MSQPTFLVSIHCNTYNHAPCIEDAMNGFCRQQTSFPFVAIIIDDSSTDGEPVVIENYIKNNFDLSTESNAKRWETDEARFIFARHKENRNCYFAVVLLKTNFYSQQKSKAPFFNIWDETVDYIALCEGDDYWTHPQKLQMQVDFMVRNQDCGLTYTDFVTYKQAEKEYVKWNYTCQTTFEEMLIVNKISTLTVVYSKKLDEGYNKEIFPEALSRKWKIGDFPKWLYMIKHSKVKYFDVTTSCYRLLLDSASHCTNYEKQREFEESAYDIRYFYANKYEVSSELKKTIAKNEIEDLIKIADNFGENLRFPLYRHMINNDIFTFKQYLSSKIRFYKLGRTLNKIVTNLRCKLALRTRSLKLLNIMTAPKNVY